MPPRPALFIAPRAAAAASVPAAAAAPRHPPLSVVRAPPPAPQEAAESDLIFLAGSIGDLPDSTPAPIQVLRLPAGQPRSSDAWPAVGSRSASDRALSARRPAVHDGLIRAYGPLALLGLATFAVGLGLRDWLPPPAGMAPAGRSAVAAAPATPPTPGRGNIGASRVVHLTSSPPGALLTVDGDRPLGTAPRTLELVGAREVTVTARLPGFAPQSRRLSLSAAQPVVEFVLEPGKPERRRQRTPARSPSSSPSPSPDRP
jgi:hypothetical protein